MADEPTGNLDTRTSFEIMEIFQNLNEKGSTIVMVTHETDIAQFAAFNKVYEEYFSAHKPARAVVEVKGLPRGVMVEVKCIAATSGA